MISASEAQLDKNERQNYRQQVYTYCNEQLQAGEEIALDDLSEELPPWNDKKFKEFTQEQGIIQRLKPWQIAVRCVSLTRIAGKGGEFTLSTLMRC